MPQPGDANSTVVDRAAFNAKATIEEALRHLSDLESEAGRGFLREAVARHLQDQGVLGGDLGRHLGGLLHGGSNMHPYPWPMWPKGSTLWSSYPLVSSPLHGDYSISCD